MKTKILDCTIRDGGYLNKWKFSKQLVKDLYRAVSKSGVDFIEIGFRSSDKFFNPEEMGVWRFTPEEVVEEVIAGTTGAAVSLMVDYGKVDIEDIPDKSQSKVSLYRVAVHKDKVLDAIELANAIADKGYQVSIQLMGIVGYTDDDFKRIIEPLEQSKLSFVYFADSYGSLLPSDIEKYIRILRGAKKEIGFHPHNNLQLAFANTLAAIENDIDIIDGTVFGMGRGAGNLPLETFITYCEKEINNIKYNVLPILELIDRYFLNLFKEQVWGYNLPYMLSGVYEVHPNYAAALIESGGYAIEDIESALRLINKINPIGFDKNIIPRIKKSGFIADQDFESDVKKRPDNSVFKACGAVSYEDRYKGRDFLVLVNGSSLVKYRDKINQFIEKYNPVIIGSNYLAGLFIPHYHSFNNEQKFLEHAKDVHPYSKLLISSSLSREIVKKNIRRGYEEIQHSEDPQCKFNIVNSAIINNCPAISLLSIGIAIVMGAKRIFIAGMDGYKDLESFMREEFGEKYESIKMKNELIKVSVRLGEYKKQMGWHDAIDKSLQQINEYLMDNNKNDLIIITPTSHKSFYASVETFLESKPEKIL